MGRMLQTVGCGEVGSGTAGKDALGSRRRISKVQDCHLDEEAVLQRGDVLAVATDL